jgi:uncharacterized protein YbbC (DUF1343 family)
MTGVTIGLERLASLNSLRQKYGRVGLVCNQASVTHEFVPAWKVVSEIFGKDLTCLLGPQHGFAGTVQFNMIESDHSRHLHTGLPIFSLYSETRSPTAEMCAHFDTLLVDLQIVGTRIYTFKATIKECLIACQRFQKRLVVLDRPNPLGGEILEGRVLDSDIQSFVGAAQIPMRHGLSAGEFARFVNKDIGAELEVLELVNWNTQDTWHQINRPWVITSPMVPSPDTVSVYPGMVLMEGTNLSEGRGTSLPFQFVGASFVRNGAEFIDGIKSHLQEIPGLFLREAAFEPTSHNFSGKECNGLQIHVTNPQVAESYLLGLAVIRSAFELCEEFRFSEPPYEYEKEISPLNLLIGSHKGIAKLTSSFQGFDDPFWSDGVDEYKENVKPFLLYERTWS